MSRPAPGVVLLRTDEVAARLGVPIETLRYWRKKGTGPKAARMGRRVVYRVADVDAWVEAQFSDAS